MPRVFLSFRWTLHQGWIQRQESRAEATMTLALPKTGLLTSQARPFVGKLYLADIGVPPELYAAPSLGFEVNTLFAEGAILQVV
jgi:NAD(P)H-hydrate epimerase